MKEDFGKLKRENERWQIAALTEQEQAELKEMENQLGYILIAYKQNQQKETKENG